MTIYGKIWKKVSDETIATPRSVQISAGFIIEWKKVNEWIPELCYKVITIEYQVCLYDWDMVPHKRTIRLKLFKTTRRGKQH